MLSKTSTLIELGRGSYVKQSHIVDTQGGQAMKISTKLNSLFICIVLSMAAACTTSPSARPVGVALDDTLISTRVKTALAGDPEVKARDVQVETFRGTVQLSGFVDSREDIQRAIDIAKRVEGVQDVQNKMTVKP